jgi:hypothetical protein
MHGHLALFLAREEGNEKLLASDAFNIGRNEDRGRLAKSAYAPLPTVIRDSFALEDFKHDVDMICEWSRNRWEEERFHIEQIDPAEVAPGLDFVLHPYIVQDCGTILFGPPGSGKSYLCQTMAVCVSTGLNTLWEVHQKPVFYINLERARGTFLRREGYIREALGIQGGSGVSYLHARGQTMRAVARTAKKFIKEHPDGVIFFDSISRAGLGALADDQTANSFTDTMNWIGGTWVGIGHTPRADASHIFGSVHFEAGEDIGVKVSTEAKPDRLGIGLSIVKANDLPKLSPTAIALEFDGERLSGIRDAGPSEFIDLLSESLSREQKIKLYLTEVSVADADSIASATGISRANAAHILSSSPQFVLVEKKARRAYYGLSVS